VALVTADGPIGPYESFTLPDPPRLVVDIPNAVHAIPQPIAARSSLIGAVRSSQYRERPAQIVRIVFDLRTAAPYRVTTAQNQLRVEVGTAAAAASVAPPAPAPAPAAAPAQKPGKVTRVDLQSLRGRQQVVIRTSGTVTYQVTESSSPLGIAVEVANATIEPSAARTVDLRQVTSPVSRLQASQQRTEPVPAVRVAAELREATRYEVRQTAAGIVVDFLTPQRPAAARPALSAPATPPAAPPAPAAVAAAPPAPPASPAGPVSGRLSMDFKDAEITNLLRLIAEVSGKNVVAGSDVTGKVTVRLINVEWEQALDTILRINNLAYEMDGNIIRVAPQAKLAAERNQRVAAATAETKAKQDELDRLKKEKEQLIEEEPLAPPELVSINYAPAKDILAKVTPLKADRKKKDNSIVVDDRTNTLIITDTKTTIAKMKELIAKLDKATPQVLIEARVVEATRSFSQSLGIEWGLYRSLNNPATGTSSGQLVPASIFTNSTAGTGLTAPTDPIPLAVSFPASGSGLTGVGVMMGSVANNLALNARISAAEKEGKTRTLSAPRVATLDNQEAEIKQGTQLPYTTVDSSGRTVVAFADAFIRLKVTPHITNDKRISLKVEAEKSSPDERITYTGGFVYSIKTAKASTNVLVNSGATVALGGLMTADEKWEEPRVPWLGKLPVLGMLFKSTSISDARNELLIFLTPTLIEEPRVM
jgi:type IV pilus assembly protein PilQ